MVDMHHMTRIVNHRRIPSEVVCIATGERSLCQPVDGREMVNSGLYEWAPIDEAGVKPIIETKTDSAGSPLPLEAVTIPQKLGPPVVVAPKVGKALEEVVASYGRLPDAPLEVLPESPDVEAETPAADDEQPVATGLWKARGK